MKSLSNRTHVSGLTRDELILFDVMFDCYVPFRLLRPAGFSESFHCQPHNLDDEQLRETLTRLVDSGLLTTQVSNGTTYFGLTPCGGGLWESERLPVWDRYASDRYGRFRNGARFVSIVAITPQVADDFWRIGCEEGMFAHTTGRVRRRTIKNRMLIPWKRFDAAYVTIGILDGSLGTTGWQMLDERRTWWRLASEMDKFWPCARSS